MRPEDELVDDDNRRLAACDDAPLSRYLVDVDCWGEAQGAPMKPATVCAVVHSPLLKERSDDDARRSVPAPPAG